MFPKTSKESKKCDYVRQLKQKEPLRMGGQGGKV